MRPSIRGGRVISAIAETGDAAASATPAKLVSPSRDSPGHAPQENIMKRFTVSAMLAAGLFASLLGASGVAHADWEDTQAAPHSEPKICCHYGVGGASKVHMRPMRINGR